MKKIIDFNTRLKPYKSLYKIFWLSFTLVVLFLFQLIMLSLTIVVPHINSGFFYWSRGVHSLLLDSRTEPHSSQGFIFAATVLGLFPSIAIIPFLYFISANWYINEKLSENFINTPKVKYMKWSKFIHFAIIGSVFILIPGLISLMNGGGLLPHHTYKAISGAFSDEFKIRTAGIAAFLYYGVGCLFTSIVVFWALGMILKWVQIKISAILGKWLEKYREWKIKKRDLKINKIEARIQNKNKKKNN